MVISIYQCQLLVTLDFGTYLLHSFRPAPFQMFQQHTLLHITPQFKKDKYHVKLDLMIPNPA